MALHGWAGLRDLVARWTYRVRWWLGLTPVQLIARRARKVLASDDRILWAGVFGSYARNRQHAKSDIDVIVYCSGTDGTPLGENIGEELEPWLARKTDCHTFQPEAVRRALGYFDIETALASQTIYGDERVVEPIRLEARRILDESVEQLQQVRDHLKAIRRRWKEAAVQDLTASPTEWARPMQRLMPSEQRDEDLLNDILDSLDKACALGSRSVAHPAARGFCGVFVHKNLDTLAELHGRCRADDPAVRSAAVAELHAFIESPDRFPKKGLHLSIVDATSAIHVLETTLDLRQIADALESGSLPDRAHYRHIHC